MSASNDTNRIEAGDLLIEKNASGEIEIHNLADGESVTIGAGGLSANAIDTEQLHNTGDILVFGGDNALIERIDPSNYTSPIAEADALIGSGGGGILLPPTTITEAAPLTGLSNRKIVGWPTATTIEFTDLSAGGFVQGGAGDLENVFIDGVTISGSDSSNRTGGSAIEIEQDHIDKLNFGFVQFTQWIDPVISVTQNLFDITWDYVYFSPVSNAGRLIHVDGGGGTDIVIHHLRGGNTTAQPAVDFSNNSAWRANIGTLQIEQGAGPAISGYLGANGVLDIDHLAWENDNVSVPEIVFLRNGGPARIGSVHFTSGTADYVYNLGWENANKTLGPVTVGNATLNNSIVNVSSDPAGPSWHWGPSSDITINHGGTQEGEVRSLADAGTGNG